MRSVRTRLSIAATTAFAAVLLPLAVLLAVQVHRSLDEGLARAADRRADQVAASFRSGDGAPELPVSPDADDVVVVVGPAGDVLAATAAGAGIEQLRDVPASSSVRTLTGLELGPETRTYKVSVVEVARGDGRYRVVAALADDDARESTRLVIGTLLIGSVLLVGLVTAGTRVLVGRALRPVERMREQAAAIGATDLAGRRIDVPPTGDELARLAVTLDELLDRLDGALQQQRRFVADAAHELRTPVAAMLSQLELRAREGAPGEGGADADLAKDARRLADLVEDLLALTRLESTRLTQAGAVDLDDIVLSEVAWLRRTSDVDVDARGVGAAQAVADAGLIARVVRNLLDNAARHAAALVTVTLNARGDNAVLTVTDDGSGIPPDERERVFQRFTRLDDGRLRTHGGAGLGLAIVREVVAMHQGSVAIEDADPGARLVVRLPLQRTEEVRANAPTPSVR